MLYYRFHHSFANQIMLALPVLILPEIFISSLALMGYDGLLLILSVRKVISKLFLVLLSVLIVLILVREWGHHSTTHVTESDYCTQYEKIQSPHHYEDRVKEDVPSCKYYQSINVSC